MRIGVLTLHDSINYGALLQACAMVRVYREMGHDACLIDRRRDPRGWALKWELSALSPLSRLAWFLNATGIWREWRRRRRSRAFLARTAGFTPYHFHDWRTAPSDLGLDRISIGSDQVWNAGIHDPLDYLPGRIPTNVPTLAYAASIGMSAIPNDLREPFREGLSRLKAVGVRERHAVTLLEELSIPAAHVADPVILAGRAAWDGLLGEPCASSGHLVVYLLGVYLPPVIDCLIDWADRTGTEVDLFVGRLVVEPLSRRGHPRLFRNLKFWRRCRRSARFHLHLDDGPETFVRALASAGAVVTSSYHALLFSVLYDRNVRFVLPAAGTPQEGMMVRIRDYADAIVRGPLLQNDLESALASVAAGERTRTDGAALERFRRQSRAWLEGAL